MQLLFAVDIGNTNIVVALYENDTIAHIWRLHTDTKRTADEYCSVLLMLFREAGVRKEDITDAVISSVVPLLLSPFIRVAENFIGKKPCIVGPAVYSRLPVTIPEPAAYQIGTDLVCNAVEAFCRCGGACIVVDFGTALTFTIVDQHGCIQGVDIVPGLRTAVQSLFANTAQLPSVPLEAPPDSLGLNTVHSIQAGIVLGYKGLVEFLTARIKQDLFLKTGAAPEDVRVFATGGLNSVLKPITDIFSEVDKELTLRGLKRIADILLGADKKDAAE
ncbi:MAG: type III pantothenate kinase [Bacteroides sp.]|nr:type III pantothenate kinase [Prevotella sp.]MCM1469443.1 type III pantothenate kinase [Bacteroides sp.]